MDENKNQEVLDAEVVETSVETPPEEGTPKKSLSKNTKIAIGIIVLGALLGGGVYLVGKERANTVAIVNGFKITRDAYDESVKMITQNATVQGVDVSDPSIQSEIHTQAIDILVNNALLIEGAKAAGVTVNEEVVATEYETLVTQLGGEEELAKRMSEVGLTKEKLESNIRDRKLADGYIEAETDIENVTVTEEEVRTLYDTLIPPGSENAKDDVENEVPAFEDLRPQLEQQILYEKRQAIVNEFLTSLRDKAKIDIKIEG